MPRKLRVIIPEQPLHLTQRGNNRVATFACDEDRLFFLKTLLVCSRRAQCMIHAFVLMTNHFHLLMTPQTADGPSSMMKTLGAWYVRYFNARYGRTGTLWEGRFRSAVIDSERYFFACSRYIELNPKRAGMVDDPLHYRWSSCRHNALGQLDRLVTPHALYLALGRNPVESQAAYRGIFETPLDLNVVTAIRSATKSGEKFSAAYDRLLRAGSVL